MQALLILIIRMYQVCISGLIGNRCRFYPSCSAYAIEAIETYGVIGGVWKATKRLCRCNPFCDGGLDPVTKNFK